MARGLTQRQAEILEFVKDFISMHGYPPTLREVGDNFGMASTRASSDHLKALERKGHVRIQEGIARGIQLIDQASPGSLRLVPGMRAPQVLPLVGRIAAGPLADAIEDVIDRVMALHIRIDRIRPDAPSSAPAMIRILLSRAKPVADPARPA